MAGEVTPWTDHVNPQGPLIRQAKVSATRRLSNIIMARAGLYTYEKEKDLSMFMICEIMRKGIWEQVENYSTYVENSDKLEVFYPFHCEPNEFHRVRVFCMVNNRVCMDRVTQRALVQVVGVWNNWGRDDGLDEPKTVPMDQFVDTIPLPPVEEREMFPEDAPITKYKRRK